MGHFSTTQQFFFDTCIFKSVRGYMYQYGLSQENLYSRYVTSKTNNYYNPLNQKLFVYKDCTFDALEDSGTLTATPWGNQYAPDGTGSRSLLIMAGSNVVLENPTFQNNSSYPMAPFDSNFILYGTPTYNDSSTNYWYPGGTILHGRKLKITVNDPDGSPLENATVSFRQKEGKEHWEFLTDSNGQVLRQDGTGIYLIEKEETSSGTFDQWSSGTGDLVHEVMVSHPDYATDKREVAMTQDREITVQLADIEAGNTRIYDSTIYDSTIY